MYLEFKEYILKLMTNQNLYKTMSTNARNSTYKYSKEVFASDILKVYHKAIEKHKNSWEQTHEFYFTFQLYMDFPNYHHHQFHIQKNLDTKLVENYDRY